MDELMENINEMAIKVLKELIGDCEDGRQIYRIVALDSLNPQLRYIFTSYAAQCSLFVNELKEQLPGLGAGDTAAAENKIVLRKRINIRSLLAKGKEKALLKECEKIDSDIEKKYSRALKLNLPLELKKMILKQHDKVRETYNEIHAIRMMI